MSKIIKAQHTRTNENSSYRPITIRAIAANKSAMTSVENNTLDEQRRIAQKKQDALIAKRQALQLKEQAERELDRARRKISEEEENSKQHIHQAYLDAQERGYREGYDDGKLQGKASYEAAIKEAENVIVSAKEEYHHYLAHAEPVILDLAMAVADRIVHGVLESDKAAWVNLVERTVQEVKEHEEVTIYVSPSQYEETKQHREELESQLVYGQDLVIFPDSSLDTWSCVIETPYGKIDASVDSQLKEIKTILRERLKE